MQLHALHSGTHTHSCMMRAAYGTRLCIAAIVRTREMERWKSSSWCCMRLQTQWNAWVRPPGCSTASKSAALPQKAVVRGNKDYSADNQCAVGAG